MSNLPLLPACPLALPTTPLNPIAVPTPNLEETLTAPRFRHRFPDCLAHEVQDGGTRAVHLAAGAGGGAEVLNELIRAG